MKKLVFLFGLNFIFLHLSVHSQTYLDYFDRATVLEEKDSLLQAEHFYLQAIRLEPKNKQNALLYANIGRLQRRQYRFGEALTSYETSLAFQPYNIEVLLERAALYLETGRDEEALKDCSLVLDFDTLNREALLMRSYINYKKQDYSESEKDYLRLSREAPQDTVASMGLAVLYQVWGKPDKAIQLWDKIIKLFPEKPENYLYRAEVERSAGNFGGALRDVDQYISLSVASADIWVLRGDLCMELGKRAEARRNYLQAIELGMPRSELRERLKRSR